MIPARHVPSPATPSKEFESLSIGNSSFSSIGETSISKLTVPKSQETNESVSRGSANHGKPPDGPVASGTSTSHLQSLETGISETSTLSNDIPIDHRPQNDKGKGRASITESENASASSSTSELYYRTFRNEEEDLPGIMSLVEQELSEPYNEYTFRYFLLEWPHLTFLVYPSKTASEPIGTIICKQDIHRGKTNRGYIAMLSVDKRFRRRGIATKLVKLAVEEMDTRGAQEVVLETEYDNQTSLALYGSLGFLREKRLQRFYSNEKDAFRLILLSDNHPLLVNELGDVLEMESESEEGIEQGRWEIGTGPADWDEFRIWYDHHNPLLLPPRASTPPRPQEYSKKGGMGGIGGRIPPPIPERQEGWYT